MNCLTKSQLKYLKAIDQKNPSVTNIASSLNCSKPSVIRGLKNLEKLNLIEYYPQIKLTDKGRNYVANINNTDYLLTKFLIEKLKIDPKLAKSDVENLRHAVSCHTICSLEKYLLKDIKFKNNCQKCHF